MSKAEQILALCKTSPALTSEEISERVSCHPAYVRSVWHRNGMFRNKHNPNVDYGRDRKFKLVPLAEYERLLAAANRR